MAKTRRVSRVSRVRHNRRYAGVKNDTLRAEKKAKKKHSKHKKRQIKKKKKGRIKCYQKKN